MTEDVKGYVGILKGLEAKKIKEMNTYDFEPLFDSEQGFFSETVIINAINALCANCKHSVTIYPSTHGVRCLQGRCDTLEQLIGRLDGWP